MKPTRSPFTLPSAHIPPVLTPPPRYSPGKNPRFLYLYNRKFLVLISLLLFLIAITLIVGLTLIFFPKIYGLQKDEPSPQNTQKLTALEQYDNAIRRLAQKLKHRTRNTMQQRKEDTIPSIQSKPPFQETTLTSQEGNTQNVEVPQPTEEMKGDNDNRGLVLRLEPQKLVQSQQQKEESMPTVPVKPLVQEATLPSHQVKPQYVQPPQRAQVNIVKPTPQRIEATVKPFIPPRERNIIPCNETCTNGGAVASCCRAHGMSDGICDERDRAICWKDQ